MSQQYYSRGSRGQKVLSSPYTTGRADQHQTRAGHVPHSHRLQQMKNILNCKLSIHMYRRHIPMSYTWTGSVHIPLANLHANTLGIAQRFLGDRKNYQIMRILAFILNNTIFHMVLSYLIFIFNILAAVKTCLCLNRPLFFEFSRAQKATMQFH